MSTQWWGSDPSVALRGLSPHVYDSSQRGATIKAWSQTIALAPMRGSRCDARF